MTRHWDNRKIWRFGRFVSIANENNLRKSFLFDLRESSSLRSRREFLCLLSCDASRCESLYHDKFIALTCKSRKIDTCVDSRAISWRRSSRPALAASFARRRFKLRKKASTSRLARDRQSEAMTSCSWFHLDHWVYCSFENSTFSMYQRAFTSRSWRNNREARRDSRDTREDNVEKVIEEKEEKKRKWEEEV